MASTPTKPARTRLALLGTTALVGGSMLAGIIVAPHVSLSPAPAFAQATAIPNQPFSFADLADKVRPSVVSVMTKGANPMQMGRGPRGGMEQLPPGLREFFERFGQNPDMMPRGPEGPQGGPQGRPQAQGSGFLISEDGYVVTNHHVIDKAEEISLAFEDGRKVNAKLIGSDARTDLALLKIEGSETFRSYLQFARQVPRVGEWVLAVGNPFGLGGTVTAGIVSAGGRNIGSGPYDYLQIDAAVNRGNSGGPAINMNGEVVGVNTAIFSPSGGNVGIAFAVPADLALTIVDKLRNGGKVARGWLGVTIQDVSDEIAESLGVKGTKGALITKLLDDGPAAKSELKARDVVIEVNGTQIKDSRDLARKVADLDPNADARLRVIRDGRERDLTIKLGTFPNEDQLASLDSSGPSDSGAEELRDLGLTIAPAREVQGAGDRGVVVTEIDPKSSAADKIQEGDVVLEVGSKAVSEPGDVVDGVREARERGRKAVMLTVRTKRQGERLVALFFDKGDERGGSR